MAQPDPAKLSSGSQACTLTTDHTLYTTAAAKNALLELEVPAAALPSDIFEVWVVKKLDASGDTAVIGEKRVIAGRASAFQIVPLAPVCAPYAAEFHIKQLVGTGRTIDWTVNAIGG